MQTSITITTHNSAGGTDITLGSLVKSNFPLLKAIDFNQNTLTEKDILVKERELEEYHYRENVLEETFEFSCPHVLTSFLTAITTFITQELKHQPGDDDYYDYHPALMEQLWEFLTICQKLPLTTEYLDKYPSDSEELWEQSYKNDILLRAIRINIDFFNALLVHQDMDDTHCGENGYYWCSEIPPISL